MDGEELFNERVRFTGKDFDEVTGLYYFNARWYDPQLGRFTSEDPVRDGMNWYVYVRNNPLRFIDPSGLESADAAENWLKNFEDAPKFATPGENLREISGVGIRTITDPEFGTTVMEKHFSIDFDPTERGDTTQPFLATAEGEVARIGYQETLAGHYIVLDHKNGYTSKYFHATDKPTLSPGTPVTRGQEIGKIGNTGRSSASPLHFEICKGGEALGVCRILRLRGDF